MITRIVRMNFTKAGVEEFLEIFNENKVAIRNFPGCTQLRLMKDEHDPLCYTTVSEWTAASDLENYRRSELFKKVWSSVKPLFSAKTQAFSMVKFIEL